MNDYKIRTKEDIKYLKATNEAEIKLAKENALAKDVAAKHIGRFGLFYITVIVVTGVGASIILDGDKIAAVVGLLSVSLTALIALMSGVAGANPEDPNVNIIKSLVDKLYKDDPEIEIKIEGDKVSIRKGEQTITKNIDQ